MRLPTSMFMLLIICVHCLLTDLYISFLQSFVCVHQCETSVKTRSSSPCSLLYNILLDSEVFLGLCFSKMLLYLYNMYILYSMTADAANVAKMLTFNNDNGDEPPFFSTFVLAYLPNPL